MSLRVPSVRLTLTLIVGTGAVVLGILMIPPSSVPERRASSGIRWTAPIEVATGKAHRGPWRMNESDWHFVDDPTVALRNDGTAGVVWTDHVEQDLFFRAYGPDGVPRGSTAVNVSQTPNTFSWLPRMVVPDDSPETIYVVWQEIIFSGGTHGGEILFSRSEDGGQTFSSPINLSNSEAGDGKGRLTKELWHNGSLDLAVGPDGAMYVAWTEYEGRLWICRSTNGGDHFSPPEHIAGTRSDPARAPALAVGPSGTVHLAWAVGEDPSANIHYARSGDPWNAFDSPREIAESEGHSDAPSLSVDRTGTVHVAYGESAAGPFRSYSVQYTSTQEGTASFTTPKVISHRHSETYQSAHFPDLRMGSGGTLYVLWELYPTPRARPRALGYTRSRKGGHTFATPSVLPGSENSTDGFNGSQQGLLMEKLAVQGSELAVVNSTFKKGDSSHVWLYRGRVRNR